MTDVASLVIMCYDWQNPLEELIKFLDKAELQIDGEIRISPDNDFAVWLKVPPNVLPAEAVPYLFDKLTQHLDPDGTTIRFATVRTPTTPTPPEPPTTGHNFAPRINQKVIDIFRAVFGPDFWTVVTRAGLAYMAASPATRQAAYIGPDVEDLPLTPDERESLIAAL
jgi:hypothetical protein